MPDKALIDLKVTGIRGGDPKYQQNKGRITIFINDDTILTDNFIAADAFSGAGNTYKRRKTTLITIHYAGKEWQGTLAQLAEELQITVEGYGHSEQNDGDL